MSHGKDIESGDAADNRRAELRLPERATLVVERMAAEYDNSEPADIIVCNSVDVSANGLQLRLDRPIPTGTILRMCAQFTDDRQPLYVVGEVKWLRPEAYQYCIGFELFDSEQTDIIGWKELVAHYFDR